jgi:hypothetical protein
VGNDGYQESQASEDRAGEPLTIERGADGKYTVTAAPGFQRSLRPAGPWVRVSGGDLPFPVEFRIHRHDDGRYVVTGLMTGDEFNPQEITAQDLRQIRLSKILAWLLRDFDPDNLPAWSPRTSIRLAAELNAQRGLTAAGRSRAPDETTLRDFARTYLTELARQPRRAMTAAARAHNISRATANRWAAICRQIGLLPDPPKE